MQEHSETLPEAPKKKIKPDPENNLPDDTDFYPPDPAKYDEEEK